MDFYQIFLVYFILSPLFYSCFFDRAFALDKTFFAQFLDLACCYPLQQEDGIFPGREFIETADESTSAAPTVYRAKTGKCKRAIDADRVEDSEEVDSSNFSSYKETETAILAKPISSHPPPKLKRSRIDNCGLGES
jgi:hypothetical protein